MTNEAAAAEHSATDIQPACFTAAELLQRFPQMHPPVIDGLLRFRETMNVVSASKFGKSWLLLALLLCVATGRQWLGRFATTRGRVLLIDNELHKPTIGNRIKTVADAMGIPISEWGDSVSVVAAHGAEFDIFRIGRFLEGLGESHSLIAIDAKYRAVGLGATENDNAAETRFFNEVDRVAEQTGSPIALVHHSSKGSQSDKRVTDVRAGEWSTEPGGRLPSCAPRA